MRLKDYLLKEKKEEVYAFYQGIIKKAKDYDKVTRLEMYQEILSFYHDDPEEILRLCSMEEIHILKNLIEEPLEKRENGYIDYLLFRNLKQNYLILEDKDKYFIPEDIYNYVKMAMNLLDLQAYSMMDVVDSVLLGISRVYNTLTVNDFLEVLNSFYIKYDISDIKKYIKTNKKFIGLIDVIRFQKKDYIISLEYPFYKDVIELRKDFKIAQYSLEEIISFGKYKINLFQEKVLSFLNFLEMHLNPASIDGLFKDLIFYCGFDINNESVLLDICDGIEELYHEVLVAIPYFPIWIYNGNLLNNLKENIILPNKNEPCICGSGKKFKNCCEKLFR